MKKIGVILSGCGFLDGAEIRESVLTLMSLDQHKMDNEKKSHYEVICMAPNINQYHVIDHTTGQEVKEVRNVLKESARIARGKIVDMSEINPDHIDAVIMPGGFGVAKNLSNFAFKGSAGEIIPEVKDFLTKIHQQKKPIGAICISPAVLTLLFGAKNVHVTIGCDPGTIAEIEKTGAHHHLKKVHEVMVDQDKKIVSTPAYMYEEKEAPLHLIYQGIDQLVQHVLNMTL